VIDELPNPATSNKHGLFVAKLASDNRKVLQNFLYLFHRFLSYRDNHYRIPLLVVAAVLRWIPGTSANAFDQLDRYLIAHEPERDHLPSQPVVQATAIPVSVQEEIAS
jgi:hypothetical protein